MTATSADECCTKRRIVAVVGLSTGVCGTLEDVAEGVDGLALEVESDVGVHRGRDADVGVAEEFSTHPHDLAFAPVWRAAPKIVVSSTLEKADWNARVIGSDVVAELTALKESGARLVLFGGSSLAGFLTGHGLIDEYQIFVHPVVLGGGKPVFRSPQQRFGLTLKETRTFDSQVVLLRHERTAQSG